METIVVGVDGSAGARAALEFAAREAALWQARLRIVCAWEIPPPAEAIVNEATAAAKEMQPTIETEGKAVQGQPAEILLQEAGDAEQIVVSNRGHGGFAGLLLGSVSHQVVQHAPCPVTIVRKADS
jgi:nucleotide-binding universal stress UspA family protein